MKTKTRMKKYKSIYNTFIGLKKLATYGIINQNKGGIYYSMIENIVVDNGKVFIKIDGINELLIINEKLFNKFNYKNFETFIINHIYVYN